ncbi:MAG TPA: YceI family protein [Isosphaeraceae bacterium]|nr:YceI family protein [Isosphaeraceae bacterium]
MHKQFLQMALAGALSFGLGTVVKADDYAIDAVHSGVSFQISHVGLAYIHGRFDDFSGNFTIDTSDPTKSAFSLSIKSESVDTNNSKRDDHLRSPDFFNVKQFPTISFTSTSVKPIDGGYEVTGDLTIHGATKPVTFSLKGGASAEFPKGVSRTGFSTSQIVVKRSDFGVGKPMPVLGDEVYVSISFEGTKK